MRVCGTHSAYVGGCRCDDCRFAARNAKRATRGLPPVQRDKYQLPVGAMPGPWIEDAKCRGMDPDFFFPTGGKGMSEPEKFCRGEDGSVQCGVRFECLEFALANRIEDGVWGGFKAEERIRMRRNRKRSA